MGIFAKIWGFYSNFYQNLLNMGGKSSDKGSLRRKIVEDIIDTIRFEEERISFMAPYSSYIYRTYDETGNKGKMNLFEIKFDKRGDHLDGLAVQFKLFDDNVKMHRGANNKKYIGGNVRICDKSDPSLTQDQTAFYTIEELNRIYQTAYEYYQREVAEKYEERLAERNITIRNLNDELKTKVDKL